MKREKKKRRRRRGGRLRFEVVWISDSMSMPMQCLRLTLLFVLLLMSGSDAAAVLLSSFFCIPHTSIPLNLPSHIHIVPYLIAMPMPRIRSRGLRYINPTFEVA